MGIDWVDLKCRCNRLLARVEEDALVDGRMLEFKCGKCERVLTVMGPVRQEPEAAERRQGAAKRHEP